MTTVASPIPVAPSQVPAVLQATVKHQVVLRDITWETYELLIRDLENQHVRLTYDNGVLEIMSPSAKHDRSGRLLGRLIYAYTEAMKIPLASFGGTTWRRKDVAKGLEADECYYVRSEPRIRGREDIQLPDDPPPDLAIEVDITHSTLDKQQVYAALMIPELWRWENEQLLIHVLRPDGTYERVQQSPSFPALPVAELQRFMTLRHGTHETAWIALFREWLRDNLSNS